MHFLQARKIWEQALLSVIQKAWISGASTRGVDDLALVGVLVTPDPEESLSLYSFKQGFRASLSLALQ